MLASHGLLLDRDYHFTQAGGTSERLESLRAGAAAATILYTPFDALAEAEGFPRLAGSEARYGAYASLCTAAATSWVARHQLEAAQYIAAVREALRLIHDPGFETTAQTVIREELRLDAATAARAHAAFVDRQAGFGLDARLDQDGLRTVITLRETYGAPRKPLGDTAAYLELGPFEEASRLLG